MEDPVISGYIYRITLMVKESISITLTAKGKGNRHTHSVYGGRARPVRPSGQAETFTQWAETSPARAPTRTSRRVGIGQGDLPHTREATSTSKMHGNHK